MMNSILASYFSNKFLEENKKICHATSRIPKFWFCIKKHLHDSPIFNLHFINFEHLKYFLTKYLGTLITYFYDRNLNNLLCRCQCFPIPTRQASLIPHYLKSKPQIEIPSRDYLLSCSHFNY